MTPEQQAEAALQFCCRGQAEAMDFLRLWRLYVHEIDDLVDGERSGPEALLVTLAKAIALYSHPFYLRNIAALRAVAYNVTNEYADCVRWERSAEEWQRVWADHHRHCGEEMALAVAQICGGYEHMRAVSLAMRAFNYWTHHTREGKAV